MDLTRADVERFRADSQQHFDLADTTIGGWTDLLRRVIDSWLVLEAKMRELEGQIARYQKYLQWQGELHVEDRAEVHELRAEIERINGLLENREEETQG